MKLSAHSAPISRTPPVDEEILVHYSEPLQKLTRLHRKESDQGNGACWYSRARKPVCRESVDESWISIAGPCSTTQSSVARLDSVLRPMSSIGPVSLLRYVNQTLVAWQPCAL